MRPAAPPAIAPAFLAPQRRTALVRALGILAGPPWGLRGPGPEAGLTRCLAGGDAVDEQGQQEDLEEKLKEYVDCLTDKRYPWLTANPYARVPAQPVTDVTQVRLAHKTPLLHPPVPRPGKVLLRTCVWPWRPAYSLTSCWNVALRWPMPWKSASRKVGCGACGGPELARCRLVRWLTETHPCRKGRGAGPGGRRVRPALRAAGPWTQE